MKIISLQFLLFCISIASGLSQDNKWSNSSLTVKFHYTDKKAPDTLSLWTYPAQNYWETSTDYEILVGSSNTFLFEFPDTTPLLHYILNKYQNNRISEIGNFFALPGDQIILNIYQTNGRDSLVFSGNGAAKYNLISKLLDHEIHLKKSISHTFSSQMNDIELISYLDSISGLILIAIQNKQQLINNFKGVRPEIKELLGYQYANYDVVWRNYIRNLWNTFKDNQTNRLIIRNRFNHYYNEFLDSSTHMSVYSPHHYQFLLNMIGDRLYYNNAGQVDLTSFYQVIRNYSHDAIVRDRALCQFLAYNASNSTNFSQGIFDSLVKDASIILKSEMAEKIIERKMHIRTGSAFFDSKFVDLNNRMFDTSTLRGKVFLYKGWGEGCGACIAYQSWFTENVWPKVKDYEDFVVLSVFDGKDRKSWDRGIATGKYTSLYYLNVSNMPKRLSEHPFYQHYRVNYMPFILLVDKKGKIVTSKPSYNPTDFVALIEKLIQEP